MKLRKQLQLFGVRTDIQVNTQNLVAELTESQAFDQSWTAASMQYDDPHNLFVKTNSWSKINFDGGSDDFYTEVNLTKPIFKSTELSEQDLARRDSMIYRVKRTRIGSKEYSEHADVINPYEMDEKFNVPELNKILSQMVGKIGRVRVAKVKANSKINPHVDYDPGYVWRYHLPLQTGPGAKLYSVRDGNVFSAHFPADGQLYWLNSGVVHWVENNTDDFRIHLLIDVHGEKEYQESASKMLFYTGDYCGKYTR